jgi:hypothetical protein
MDWPNIVGGILFLAVVGGLVYYIKHDRASKNKED